MSRPGSPERWLRPSRIFSEIDGMVLDNGGGQDEAERQRVARVMDARRAAEQSERAAIPGRLQRAKGAGTVGDFLRRSR